MLQSKLCVGWDWFKYMDNDPEDLSTDPSNRDSNKGIVTIRYQPYAGLVEGMREFNRETTTHSQGTHWERRRGAKPGISRALNAFRRPRPL